MAKHNGSWKLSWITFWNPEFRKLANVFTMTYTFPLTMHFTFGSAKEGDWIVHINGWIYIGDNNG